MSGWRFRAKCRTVRNPERYASENVKTQADAQRLCGGCPVEFQCLDEALEPMDVSRIDELVGNDTSEEVYLLQSDVLVGGVALNKGRQASSRWESHPLVFIEMKRRIPGFWGLCLECGRRMYDPRESSPNDFPIPVVARKGRQLCTSCWFPEEDEKVENLGLF